MALVFLCEPASALHDAVIRQLEAAGHRVRSLLTSAALFEALPKERPDAVVLDEQGTAGISGLYLAAARLRGTGLTPIPTLAIIDKADAEARAAALQMVDDALSRPVHVVELVARIESLLRGRGSPPDRSEDTATGLRNRGYLDERLVDEWKRATRFSEPLAFCVVGIEDPSRTRADRMLREVGAALRRSLRQVDVLARWSAIEGAALLPNTHLAGALTCAERLQREIGKDTPHVIGLAFYPGKDVTSAGDLTRTAEKAVARARVEGPGSICLVQHQGYLFAARPR